MALGNRTKKWLRGGLEILIHGGWAAVVSSISAAMVDQDHFAFGTAAFFKMMLAGFIGNGGLRFAQYMMNNPLPPEGDSTPPIPGIPVPSISLNPLAKVQTMLPNPDLTKPADASTTPKP